MAIKIQYITSDNMAFDNAEEAKAYEIQLEQAKHPVKEYHVTLIINCECYVNAHDDDEAIDKAIDEWNVGNLDSESIVDAYAEEYEEKEW